MAAAPHIARLLSVCFISLSVGAFAAWKLRAERRDAPERSNPAPLSPQERAPPVVRIPAADLDVGDVLLASNLDHSIRVENPGSGVVEVSAITAPCDCTSVAPRSFQLDPGGVQNVSIRIDLSRAGGDPINRTRRMLRTGLKFEFADGRQQETTLEGVIIHPFVANDAPLTGFSSASTIRIESPLRAGQEPTATRFPVDKDNCVDELIITADPADGVVRKVLTDPGGSFEEWEVIPAPREILGPFTFDLTASARLRDGTETAPATLRVSGVAEGGVTWVPQQAVLLPTATRPEPTVDVTLQPVPGRRLTDVVVSEQPLFASVEVLRGDGDADSEDLFVLRVIAQRAVASPDLEGMILVHAELDDEDVAIVPIPVMLVPLLPSTAANSSGVFHR